MAISTFVNFSANTYKSPTRKIHRIASDDFFLLSDSTSEGLGTIIKDGKLGFRSSWGVWNEATSKTDLEFKITNRAILEHLGLQNNQNIVLKSFKPTKIGFLPLVRINKPPILSGEFSIDHILFNNYRTSINSSNSKEPLLLPKGHNSGAEWWRGVTSVIGPIVAILLAIKTGGLSLAKYIATGKLGIGLLLGAAFNEITSRIRANKIRERRVEVENIYNSIMRHPHYIYGQEINLEQSQNFSLNINANLQGGAKATSIWGLYSEMYLDIMFMAINGEIEYEETIFT